MGGHRAFGAGDDLVDGPVDLAAVRADDALLDAIAGGALEYDDRSGDVFGRGRHGDDDLAAILASWKADIEADPMPELVTLDEAEDAVEAGHAARERQVGRARRRMPFAVAAAAVVVAFTGFTVAVHGAQPGDAMFSLTKVFFAQHASNVERATEARRTIVEANQAIERGDRAQAETLLRQAQGAIAQVEAGDQPELVQQQAEVQQSLDAVRPGPGVAPPPASDTAPGSSESEGPDVREPEQTADPQVSPSPEPTEPSVVSPPEEGTTPVEPTGTEAGRNATTTPAAPTGPAAN